MNDNRLYIMKDFTYACLCKHLHNMALLIHSIYCHIIAIISLT